MHLARYAALALLGLLYDGDSIPFHGLRFRFESRLIRKDRKQKTGPDHTNLDLSAIFENRNPALGRARLTVRLAINTLSALCGLQTSKILTRLGKSIPLLSKVFLRS